ncbi:unnamed protein product, partial [Closterium sp. NIES-53]
MPPCHALSVSNALAESTPLPPTTTGSPRASSPRGTNFSTSPYKTPFRLPASPSIVHDAVAMHHAAYGWTDDCTANHGEAGGGGGGAGAGGAAERRARGSGGFGSSTALELTPPSSPSSAAADAHSPTNSLRDLASNTRTVTSDVAVSTAGVCGDADADTDAGARAATNPNQTSVKDGRHEESSQQHEGTEQESPARQFVRDLALVRALILADACTVAEASRRMAARHVDACLLTDAKSGMLCGILTDRDVAERCVGEGRSPQSTPCHAVMTRDPQFVSLHAPAAVALKKMVNGKFRHLPVVDGGEVVAMLPVRSCLAEALLRAEEVRGKGADVAEALKEAERTGGSDGAAAGILRALCDGVTRPAMAALLAPHTRPAAVRTTDTVAAAAKAMRKHGVTAVLVSDYDQCDSAQARAHELEREEAHEQARAQDGGSGGSSGSSSSGGGKGRGGSSSSGGSSRSSSGSDSGRGRERGAVVKEVCGILTSRDILLRVIAAGLDPSVVLVEQAMTHAPVTVPLHACLLQALRHMDWGGFSHLPVTAADGSCVACVGVTPILSALFTGQHCRHLQ